MSENEPLVGTELCRCGNEKREHDFECQECFHKRCNRYRAMRKSVAGKSEKEQTDAINRFRCGL